jgi:NAD-dependent SIR2 family protein deacetylase
MATTCHHPQLTLEDCLDARGRKGWPRTAAERGACVIEVNLDATPLSPLADYVLRGESGKLLPAQADVLSEAIQPPG